MRKTLLGLLLFLCVMSPHSTSAQNRVPPKVGVLWPVDASTGVPYQGAFEKGMRGLGWVDGENVRFIVRYGDNVPSRFPMLVAELIAFDVDLLFIDDQALPVALRATTKIPIVCGDFNDPVAEGFTSNLAKPDRNVTGVSWQSSDIAQKQLELAKELIPGLKRVAVIFEAGDRQGTLTVKSLLSTAEGSNPRVRLFAVSNSRDIEAAFIAMRADRTEALIVVWQPLTEAKRHEIHRLASGIRLPTISEGRVFAEAGMLVTLGVDGLAAFERAAYFVDRILKGTKPTELPIEQATIFELVVNLKTAKALGLAIPESIMLRATKVIR